MARHGRFGHADLFQLDRTPCSGEYDDGRDCEYAARFVAALGGPGNWRVAGFCGVHAPDPWREDALDVPVFDLDAERCGSVIQRAPTDDAPPGRGIRTSGCGFTGAIAVRDPSGDYDTYCRVHARLPWLVALGERTERGATLEEEPDREAPNA